MLESLSSLLCLCVLFNVSWGSSDVPVRVLYIGDSSQFEYAIVNQAAQDINNSSSILPGYAIHIVTEESSVYYYVYACDD